MTTGDELAAAGSVVAGDVATTADLSHSADTAADTANDANDHIEFVVQYGRVNNMTMYETIAKLENVSTTKHSSSSIPNQIKTRAQS